MLPAVSILNERNFDVSRDDGYIYLYAGFTWETFTTTFHFGDSIPTEQMEITYDTPIREIVPTTRNSQGFAVLSWSKTADGNQPFTGNITEETHLYATEWAPCIQFDCNGGDTLPALVARSGATVALPTPTKTWAKFLYWETAAGAKANITTMPANSITLKAVWQGKIVFDENGGTDVDDISLEANQTVTLPMPEKEGYVFAGWYTADKDLYTSTKMPVAGVQLKAGWYKAKKQELVLLTQSGPSKSVYNEGAFFKIDLDKYSPLQYDNGVNVQLSLHFTARHIPSTACWNKGFMDLYVGIYDDQILSDIHCITNKSFFAHDQVEDWRTYECSFAVTVTHAEFYIGMYASGKFSSPCDVRNFYVDMTYPDTNYLYL